MLKDVPLWPAGLAPSATLRPDASEGDTPCRVETGRRGVQSVLKSKGSPRGASKVHPPKVQLCAAVPEGFGSDD